MPSILWGSSTLHATESSALLTPMGLGPKRSCAQGISREIILGALVSLWQHTRVLFSR